LIRTLAAQGTTVLVTTHYMDEAEFCDRVGLMVDGRLAALDTPHQLKCQFVPGTLLHVRHAGPEAAGALRALPGEVHVESFGAGLHVRIVGADTDPDRIEAMLRRTDAAATVEVLEPTLEDVFLEVVRTASIERTDVEQAS
jgi:ABC-2 type transport system ATP-binding protein